MNNHLIIYSHLQLWHIRSYILAWNLVFLNPIYLIMWNLDTSCQHVQLSYISWHSQYVAEAPASFESSALIADSISSQYSLHYRFSCHDVNPCSSDTNFIALANRKNTLKTLCNIHRASNNRVPVIERLATAQLNTATRHIHTLSERVENTV